MSRRSPRSLALLFVLLSCVPELVEAQRPIPPDFASMRGEASAAAGKSLPGATLHQVDVTGRVEAGSLRVRQGYFFYAHPGPPRRGLIVQVVASGNVDPPGVHETRYSVSSSDTLPATLPAKVIGPDDALRRLNVPAPVPWSTVGLTLFLQQGGALPLRRPQGAGDWGPFFRRTTDPRKWYWWTTAGRGAATQFFYVDAVSGEVTSECAPLRLRADSAPIPCPAAGAGAGPPSKVAG